MDIDLLTIKQASEMLKVSKLTIYRNIKSNKLPAYRLGRDLRIKKADLIAFLEKNRTNKEGTNNHG